MSYRWTRRICSAVLAWALIQSVGATGHGDQLPDTIAKVKRSIVAIGTVLPTRQPPGKFVATGFVVGNGQYALTNAHALPKSLNKDRREYIAVLSGKGKGDVREAVVVSENRTHDLALLRFKGAPLPALELGASRPVREGQLYAFTGFPIGIVLGYLPVTHRGIVSAITPIVIPQLSSNSLDAAMLKRLNDPYDVYQLDATAYPGNSGSPLYEIGSGRVIGVINKVFVKKTKEKVLSDPSGITYAIPIQFAQRMLQRAGVK